MKFRGLLTATVILAALAGILYWSNHAPAAKPSETSTSAPAKILAPDQADIVKLQIRNKGSDEVTVAKDNSDAWQITAPKSYPADSTAVASLLTTLAPLTAEEVVEDKATDLDSYGLAQPSAELVVTEKSGKSQRLLIGDDTPTHSGAYVALAGDARVFTIASYTKTSLLKGVDDLRQKPAPEKQISPNTKPTARKPE